ncbi:putative transporter [Microdochium trichocladiopsis]|uniref:Transporter n=1 Tax=Microdochium trichocladiopsis TaxID=1682393 RepID=A0A9P9BQ68_9PEZI|nr:putative transporter [Microdochium trichocladiopsis]KAH7030575.1 putative transporter [Microdochium trichocladiopsis]
MAHVASPATPAKDASQVSHVEDGVSPQDVLAGAAARGQSATGYEHLTPWQTASMFRYATLVCFLAAFSAAADCYQVVINSGIIANAGFVHRFATETDATGGPALSSPVLSGWGSTMSVGQVLGMLSLSFVSARVGRKPAMYALWGLLVASVIVECVAWAWPHWLVAKLFAGVGIGGIQTIIPTFWWSIGGVMGTLALQRLNAQNALDYLTPIYTQWAQIGIMGIIYLVVPESPAWYVSVGKVDQAQKALERLNGKVAGYDAARETEALALMAEHERALAVEQRREHWYAIFQGVDGKRTLTTLWTITSQQFIGLTLFGTFGTYFFQQAGLQEPFTITLINASIGLGTVLLTVLAVDSIGRRNLACAGTTVCWLACVAIGVVGVAPTSAASTYVFVAFTCVWQVGLAINGATGWGYIGEISSQRLRPYTAGFSAAVSCIVGIVMNILVPYMVNSIQWNWGLKTGWFYAGVGLPFVVGMWLLIPETTGRSAAELDELFERKIKPWRFHKTETSAQRPIAAVGEKE